MMTPKIASSCLASLALVGCFLNVDNQKAVTVYVSADEQIAREVFDAFTEKTGIEVFWVGDTESSKTTALVQRLHREKNNPVAAGRRYAVLGGAAAESGAVCRGWGGVGAVREVSGNTSP